MFTKDQKNVEKNLKSFEEQQLDAEALKKLTGGTGGGTGSGDEEDPPSIVTDDIILP